MQLRNKHLRVLLLLLLITFFVWRGLLPALNGMDTDFPNYYTAGRIVLDGGDVSRLYDDAWFQMTMDTLGIHSQGKFSPFPPPTALLFVPMGLMNPETAFTLMIAINLAALFAGVLLISKIAGVEIIEAAILALLAGTGLANCVRLGQLYILVSVLSCTGYYWYARNKPVSAGLALGALVPVKYFPAAYLLYFSASGKWKLLFAAAGACLIFTGASLLVLGWEIHWRYLGSVIGAHLQSHLSGQNPFSTSFQSFDSLLRNAFVYDEVLNVNPLVNSVVVYNVLKYALTAVLIVVTLFLLIRLRHAASSVRDPAVLSMLAVLGLLIAPATATYHYVLLWLPIALVSPLFHRHNLSVHKWICIAAYGGIGFIPYSLFLTGGASWIRFVLPYPRLYLLLALFFTILHGVCKLVSLGTKNLPLPELFDG